MLNTGRDATEMGKAVVTASWLQPSWDLWERERERQQLFVQSARGRPDHGGGSAACSEPNETGGFPRSLEHVAGTAWSLVCSLGPTQVFHQQKQQSSCCKGVAVEAIPCTSLTLLRWALQERTLPCIPKQLPDSVACLVLLG